MINQLSIEIHENNKAKGFYEGEKNIGEILCLIHSEVSEALEADRKGIYIPIENRIEWVNELKNNDEFKSDFKQIVKNTFEDELADIMIRVMDLAAYKNIDLESHIKAKMRYNKTRGYMHGKKY